LRFLLRRCGVRNGTPHSSVSRALPLEFFCEADYYWILVE